MQKFRVEHLHAPEDGFLLDILQKNIAPDKMSFAELLQFGCVYVNSERCTQNIEVKTKDYVRIHMQPRRYQLRLHSMPQDWYFENEHFVIAIKPHGLAAHELSDNLKENFKYQLEQKLSYKLFTTGRLDVGTSGFIFYARNIHVQRTYNYLLRERMIHKEYIALCQNPIQPGQYTHFMEASEKAPKVVCDAEQKQEDKKYQECILEVLSCTPFEQSSSPDFCNKAKEYFATSENLFVLNIRLHTGRTHQIRAQLAHLGAPILGDTMYKSPVQAEDCFALWASHIKFRYQDIDYSFASQDAYR